jgi:hypothetical protein
VTPYLLHLPDVISVLVTWAAGAVLLLAGAGLIGNRLAPEFQIAAGWGALCLVLTCWGVFVPLTLGIPAIGFIIAALGMVLLPARRPTVRAWEAVGKMLASSLPLWLILAPIRPSQPDTFLNLLPNAFYLADYGRFPSSVLPPSPSLLPAAPYNTQLLSYLGSLLKQDYPGSGMSLMNVMLQLVAALALARALAGHLTSPDTVPGWGLTAFGFLLATLLNPGFVPRIDFAAYGEPALAAATLLAVCLFVRAQSDLAAGDRPTPLVPLALVLAAIVNIKQTGLGMVAALMGAALIGVWSERGLQTVVAVKLVGLTIIPAVFVYAVWRYHVAHAGVAELRPLSLAEWNWPRLPETAASALDVVSGKPLYFGCVLLATLLLPLLLCRQGWTVTTRFLTINAALFVLYNIFILMTYIAAFPAEMSVKAHSYFRYNTHLSLVLVASLALAVRDLGAGAWLSRQRYRLAGAAIVVCALLAPVAFVKRLRFDLEIPPPLVWDLAKKLSPYLQDGDRLALLLPGDNDSVAAMISGVLAETAPRRRMLDLLSRNTASPAALDEVARLGYPRALISCTPQGWQGLPPGQAVLLRQDTDGWHPVVAWPYPADAAKQRWQHILSWGPLCRSP